MAVFLAWLALVATVALILMPADVPESIQLVVRVLLAAMVGIAVPALLEKRMRGFGPTMQVVLQIYRAGAGAAALVAILFFNLYPMWAQALIAALIGVAAIWSTQDWIGRIDFVGNRTGRFTLLVQVLLILSWLVFIAGIAYALIVGQMTDFVQAAGLVILGTLAICFAAYTAKALAEGRAFQVESHWGGLGGGLGGWRISQPVILVVLTIVFSGATATVLMTAGTPIESEGADSSTDTTVDAGNTESEEEAVSGSEGGTEQLTETEADEQADPGQSLDEPGPATD